MNVVPLQLFTALGKEGSDLSRDGKDVGRGGVSGAGGDSRL